MIGVGVEIGVLVCEVFECGGGVVFGLLCVVDL